MPTFLPLWLDRNVVDDVLQEIRVGGYIELGNWTLEGTSTDLEIFKGSSGGTYFFGALSSGDDVIFPYDLDFWHAIKYNIRIILLKKLFIQTA